MKQKNSDLNQPSPWDAWSDPRLSPGSADLVKLTMFVECIPIFVATSKSVISIYRII